MKQLYRNLTGRKIVWAVRRRSLLLSVFYALILIVFAAVAVFLISECLRDIKKSWWLFLLTFPAWIPAFYFPGVAFLTHFAEFRLAEQNDVFLRYGSPR